MDELEQMVCGHRIGSGIHRTVYVYAPDTTCVIKVARDEDGCGANILEHKLWNELHEWNEGEKWFAPVIESSRAGKYLIMKRAEMGRDGDYPKKIPHFFTDLKYDNFGFIGKQLVCIDYSSAVILTENWSAKRMKKAGWWKN